MTCAAAAVNFKTLFNTATSAINYSQHLLLSLILCEFQGVRAKHTWNLSHNSLASIEHMQS